MLPSNTTLRVRLVAPVEARIAEAQRCLNFSWDEATHWIEQTDAGRGRFVRDPFHLDAADPHHYDRVVNTAHLSVVGCVDLVIAALHRRADEMRTAAAIPTRAAVST